MRRLVSTVVVLVALLVLIDRGGVLYAQNRVAGDLHDTERLSSQPTVKIHGFPFLTQLFRGRYSDIEVIVRDYAPAHSIPVDRIDVHLHDARVPFSGLDGSVDRVPVRHVDAVVRFEYHTLSSAHDGLTFSYAGGDKVRVTGGVSIAGRRLSASATGQMHLIGDAFAFGLQSADVTGAAVAGLDSAAQRVFGVATRVPSLPFHFRLQSVRATPNGIEITGAADNVILTPAGG